MPRPFLAPVVALLVLAAGSAPARAQASPRGVPPTDVLPPPGDPLAGFDAYAERARREWQVPGMSVAMVRNDSVVLLRGYGVRTLGRPEPVGPRTLFANASTTKAFTAMAAALLVDAGRLRWDDRVADRVPGFGLSDPLAARELTLRDVLRHQMGFGDPGFLWYATADSLASLLPRLRRVPAQTSFRAHFAYNNLGYGLAGAAVGAAAGTTWDTVVRDRLLAPLGMRDTRTRGADVRGDTDVATAHDLVADTLRPLPAWTRTLVDNIPAAGSMYSSAADMTRWLRFLLDPAHRVPDAPAGAAALVSDSAFAELLAPQTLVGADEFYPSARLTRPAFTAYGLGWFLQDYRGEKIAFHTGSIDGTVAIVGLLPARRTGVVVFANRDHAELRHALMLRAFDATLDAAGAPGPRARDWSTQLRALYDSAAQLRRTARARTDSLRLRDPRPPRPTGDYTGTYADSLYGRASVRADGGRLVLTLSPHLVADLEPQGGDAFLARWRAGWMTPDAVIFVPAAHGRVRRLELGSDGATFARVPDRGR
jgi:CubicO group peptidase (beta-lactamase class C family)